MIFVYSLQYLWENGLLNYWLKTYTPNVDKCMTRKIKTRGRMTSFTFGDVSSAFALLGIGIGLAMLFFFLEMIGQHRLKSFFFPTMKLIK